MAVAGAAAATGVTNLIGSNISAKANKDIASEQAATSKYGVDVNAQLSREQLANQQNEFAKQIALAQQAQALAERGQTSAEKGQEEQYGISKSDLEARRAQEAASREAYKNATAQLGTTQQGLNQMYDTASPELGNLKQNILQNQTENLATGQNALKASLAQSGVRGGQAALALSRNAGDVTRQAQQETGKLISEEALAREKEKRASQQAMQQQLSQYLYSPSTSGSYSK